MILTVPTDARGVRVTATRPVTHLCPHVDEIDNGTVSVTWHTTSKTVELHSLSEYLMQFASLRISHEDLVSQIKTTLSALSGIESVSVHSWWMTAGMDVEVAVL